MFLKISGIKKLNGYEGYHDCFWYDNPENSRRRELLLFLSTCPFFEYLHALK